MQDQRNKVSNLISQHIKDGDATGWFEILYSSAANGEVSVPWARNAPDPQLVSWLRDMSANGDGKTALVIGCGLGDDAIALEEFGYTVTAFDISQSAIDWAKQRFPDSNVDFVQADLFHLPKAWRGAFDFVFESRTIQALPWDLTESAIKAIADCVADGGQLLVHTFAREPHESRQGIPWPLSRDELALFEAQGLQETQFIDYHSGRRHFAVLYHRPEN